MQLYYQKNIKNDQHVLDQQESRHLVKVLRMGSESEVWLTNGEGDLFKTKITEPNPKACVLEIIEKITQYNKRDYYLHMAVAPTKNIDRFEWFLEKATEIGVDEITPLITDHSERKVIKTERLEKVLVAAMKQSQKTYKPVLNDLVSYTDFLKSKPIAELGFIAHCANTKKELLKDSCRDKKNVLVLIGPEGDFSEREIEKALTADFIPVSLGDSRLRTETAGVVACHTVALLNQ